MLHLRWVFIISMSVASVVVFPCPAGPEIRIIPCGFRAKAVIQSGRFSSLREGISSATFRMEIEIEFLCL